MSMDVPVTTVRDRFWLWGHQEGSHNGQYDLAGKSRMTPAEAAYYMGIPNLMMVGYGGEPEPPFDQYAKSMVGLKRLVWSVVGDSSSTRNNQQSDLEEVIALAQKTPNLTGGILDDFFHAPDENGRFSRHDLPALRHFHESLHAITPPLDLYVVLYNNDLNTPLQEFLQYADAVTYWTWTADQLPHLERDFARAEALAGGKRMLLGCYLYDYGAGLKMTVENMKYQCEIALEWLQTGRIEGIVFLASCICDLDLDAVEWTRRWIEEIGDRELLG
jgi:hypothetical protein